MTNRVRSSPDAVRWAERIAGNAVEADGGCWQWVAARDRYGYGRFKVAIDGAKKQTGAHRASWLAYRGDIPDSLVIDHLCRNRACVNPDHMELVTNRLNTIRGDHSGKKGRSGRRPGPRPYSCRKHDRDDGRLSVDTRGYVRWVCRICARARHARWQARVAASAI